jgi:hypothetical protein
MDRIYQWHPDARGGHLSNLPQVDCSACARSKPRVHAPQETRGGHCYPRMVALPNGDIVFECGCGKELQRKHAQQVPQADYKSHSGDGHCGCAGLVQCKERRKQMDRREAEQLAMDRWDAHELVASVGFEGDWPRGYRGRRWVDSKSNEGFAKAFHRRAFLDGQRDCGSEKCHCVGCTGRRVAAGGTCALYDPALPACPPPNRKDRWRKRFQLLRAHIQRRFDSIPSCEDISSGLLGRLL